MARNKYPEETVNLILDVSLKLFIEKGYDETSIQDIIDNLGGLSKGAIYHHFKSKESILVAVYNRISESIEEKMTEIRTDKSLNGMEKLQKMFFSSLQGKEEVDIFTVTPNLLENPRLLAMHLNSTIKDVVPNYIEPVINEGINDGSIVTDYPKEVAEIMILMGNLWMNPLIYDMTYEDIASKIKFFNFMMTSIGMPIIDKSMEDRLQNLAKISRKI